MCRLGGFLYASRFGLEAASQPNLLRALLSLRAHRLAHSVCSGVVLGDFWLMCNGFSGFLWHFDHIQEINSGYEVCSISLTPTLLLVFRKLSLFSGASLDDFRPDSLLLEIGWFVTLSLSENRTTPFLIYHVSKCCIEYDSHCFLDLLI